MSFWPRGGDVEPGSGLLLPARPQPHPPALIIPSSRQLSRQSPSGAAEYQTRRRVTRFPIIEPRALAPLEAEGKIKRRAATDFFFKFYLIFFPITTRTSCSPEKRASSDTSRGRVCLLFSSSWSVRPPQFTVTHLGTHVAADMECSRAAAFFFERLPKLKIKRSSREWFDVHFFLRVCSPFH